MIYQLFPMHASRIRLCLRSLTSLAIVAFAGAMVEADQAKAWTEPDAQGLQLLQCRFPWTPESNGIRVLFDGDTHKISPLQGYDDLHFEPIEFGFMTDNKFARSRIVSLRSDGLADDLLANTVFAEVPGWLSGEALYVPLIVREPLVESAHVEVITGACAAQKVETGERAEPRQVTAIGALTIYPSPGENREFPAALSFSFGLGGTHVLLGGACTTEIEEKDREPLKRLRAEWMASLHAATQSGTSDFRPVSDGSFPSEVRQAQGPVVVMFSAPWCRACQKVEESLRGLETEIPPEVRTLILDVDLSPDAKRRYGIPSIPALQFYQDGEIAGMSLGVHTKSELKSWVIQLLSEDSTQGGEDGIVVGTVVEERYNLEKSKVFGLPIGPVEGSHIVTVVTEGGETFEFFNVGTEEQLRSSDVIEPGDRVRVYHYAPDCYGPELLYEKIEKIE